MGGGESSPYVCIEKKVCLSRPPDFSFSRVLVIQLKQCFCFMPTKLFLVNYDGSGEVENGRKMEEEKEKREMG